MLSAVLELDYEKINIYEYTYMNNYLDKWIKIKIHLENYKRKIVFN